jgi:hypothetical protein
MLLLATQAEPQMRPHCHPNLGRLLQPRHYPRADATASSGVRWAADNDAYGGYQLLFRLTELPLRSERARGLSGRQAVGVPVSTARVGGRAPLPRFWR